MEPSALSGEFNFQSGVFAQLLPVFLRHFLSQFQGSLGSGVDSVVNDHDMTTAQLVQTFLQSFLQPVNLRSTATDDDPVANPVLEFGVEGGDQFLNAFGDMWDQFTDCCGDLIGDIDLGGATIDRELNQRALVSVNHAAESFLRLLDHVGGELDIRSLLSKQLADSSVHVISGMDEVQ